METGGEELVALLERKRKDLKEGQEAFARRLGVSRAFYGLIKGGKEQVSGKMISPIASLLGITTEEVIAMRKTPLRPLRQLGTRDQDLVNTNASELSSDDLEYLAKIVKASALPKLPLKVLLELLAVKHRSNGSS